MKALLSDMKKCFKCLSVKSFGDFYKHPKMTGGRLNKCKECVRLDVDKYRLKNLERLRAYDKQKAKAYSKTETSKKTKINYRKNNLIKGRAHSRVQYLIESGKMKRLPCEVCGEVKSQAHHDDYNKPLDVRFLCQIHHSEHHKNERAQKRGSKST